MNISINEIRAYIACPYYYRFRYKSNTPLLEIKAIEHWHNCVRGIIMDSMKETIRTKSLMSLASVQDMWNKSWFVDPMALKFSTGQTHSKLGINGWLVIQNFYKMIAPVVSSLVSIEQPYSLPIRNTSHFITGTIDLLMQSSTGYLATKLVNSDYHTKDMVGHNDIEMTAYRKAIRNIFDAEPNLAYYVLDPRTTDLVDTKRYNAQNEVLDETALSIINAIESESYYPNFGRRCSSCDYLSFCNRGRWVHDTSLLKY